jgi:RNA polymerase sigma factor (sigma-70 family)
MARNVNGDDDGDGEAPRRDSGFDEFVRGRSTALLRSAYLLTGDQHAAQDLLQEVLERMYVRWRHIRHSPEAYARRALVHRAVNRWRWRRRRPEAALLPGDDRPTPDHAERYAVRDTVVRALRELPPRQRAVVVLRYLDDLVARRRQVSEHRRQRGLPRSGASLEPSHDAADTAAALGCSVGSVKSHASRGLARLRTSLATAHDPSTTR